MTIFVKIIDPSISETWDKYVYGHPDSISYHLFSWKTVIEKTYGHKTYYLAAFTKDLETALSGILPLVHLKHVLFGNSLISLPFFDMGGILADNDEIEKALLDEAIKLGKLLNIDRIEFRHTNKHDCFSKLNLLNSMRYAAKNHKVRMLLELPDSSKALITSFKSKLRSQIKKSIKMGLKSKIGGLELLDDFYSVFLINMRDLGSPVHSKKLMRKVMEQFNDHTRIVTIHKDKKPYAASIIFGFKDILENPWSSSLRKFSRLSPHMLLYWTMLEYACDNGYKYFDFGRSTPGQGTYKFKQQWGAKPETLHWQYLCFNNRSVDEERSENSRFNIAIQFWQKLPVNVTAILGPMIRKNIGL